MLTLDELSETQASVNPNVSVGLFNEIFDQASWRLYTSDVHLEAEAMANRYLGAHAQIPGGFAETLSGIMPIETFRFQVGGKTFEGFLFLNGAVVKIHDATNYVVFLFVDETIASMWGYPSNFLSYEDRQKLK